MMRRYLKLWVQSVPIVLVALLVVVLALIVFAFAMKTDLSVPLLIDITGQSSGRPMWAVSVVGIAAIFLFGPPLIAALWLAATRGKEIEGAR